MAAIPIGIAFTISEGGIAILAPTLAFLGRAAVVAAVGLAGNAIVNEVKEGEEKVDDCGRVDKQNEPAKAPGKPKKEDGFEPPKRKSDSGMKAPSSGGKKGWPDKKGSIWKPSGPRNGDGSRGPHGGPHWDVEDLDGNHWNVYPGGRIRK
ncbi:hypothetical protein TWF106_007177 [Orbilia oligospora]|uniref:Toxin 37-like C-terminal domain-containing protein n=1 Tax=Orbilia oligospora TaxID=2813651 RepID=A0A6G1MP08_ORBOL|nr:hypothetical protein TWF788_000421 [Orbilia oligospora]KAF3202527.1 hypothetical protein TWF679_010772 [Orbilia oligospora]KAF3214062.1 hypothetical protein TWF191_009883 [Orbilia oligospora]KAF3219063.1 hypothetical protein TWF106_007177 [Orbilia oligospora]KAF3263573.1 hypothetical protein TWF192_005852 [Orbilia oligospora]